MVPQGSRGGKPRGPMSCSKFARMMSRFTERVETVPRWLWVLLYLAVLLLWVLAVGKLGASPNPRQGERGSRMNHDEAAEQVSPRHAREPVRNEYQCKVLAAVHLLRVDPDSEVDRLMLADLLEEGDREGVVQRCCKHLREGKMVCNSLDSRCITCLRFLATNPVQMPHVHLSAEERAILSNLGSRLPPYHRVVLTPEEYRRVWEMAYRHRAVLIAQTREVPELGWFEVAQEAVLVHEERTALPLKESPSPTMSVEEEV